MFDSDEPSCLLPVCSSIPRTSNKLERVASSATELFDYPTHVDYTILLFSRNGSNNERKNPRGKRIVMRRPAAPPEGEISGCVALTSAVGLEPDLVVLDESGLITKPTPPR